MMMTGSSRAQKPLASSARRSLQGNLGVSCVFSRRDTSHQATTSDRPIRTPGTMPAKNSLVTDRLATTPNSRKPMDGGMTGAMMPPAAISPQARPTS